MGYLLAALLGGFLVFNTQATPDKAAEVMRETLQQRFPGAQVETQVEGKRGRDVLKGRFKRVRIHMANFRFGTIPAAAGPSSTPPALRATHRVGNQGRIGLLETDLQNFQFGDLQVQAFRANFQDAVFDWKILKKESRVELQSCGPATANLSLTPVALETLMREKLSDIAEPRLSIRGDKVQITGKRDIPLIGLGVPFSLIGNLEARNGNEVWLTNPALKVSGVGLAAPIAGAFLRNLNPLYVFDKERQLPFRVVISNMQNREGTLELSGQLQFVPAPPAKE